MTRSSQFVAAAVLAATSTVHAQTDRFEPEHDRLNEELRAQAQISGGLVAGVMAPGASVAERPRLMARVPADWAGSRPCVRVISADGLYVAETSFAAPDGWRGGEAPFDYRSDYADVLRARYAIGDASAAAISKEPCEEEPRTFVPAYWNVEPGSPSTIVIHVNSASADRVYLFASADPSAEPVLCEPTTAPRRIGYDFTCTVPVPPGTDKLEVELNRVRGGSIDMPRIFEVLLPP